LENRAWERFKAKDASYSEKAAAWGVTTGMKTKRKLGAGCGFNATVKAVKNVMKKNMGENNLKKLIKKCLSVARKTFKKNKNKNPTPRVIPIPKAGGMLPLIPIFAGLSALGSLTGGAAAVAKIVTEFNRSSPTHLGKGLYLTPHKGGSFKIVKGKGLYQAPYKSGGGPSKKLKKTTKN